MKLETALAGALVAAQDQVTLPTSVQGIAALYGPDGRGVSGLARALFETGNSKSYEAARRNVERYIRTEKGIGLGGANARRPNAHTRETLNALAATRIDRATIEAIKRDGVTIRFSGEVIVSPEGKRPDARDRDIDTYIPGDDAAAFLDRLIERKLDSAGDEFSAAMLGAYGIGGAAVISDVDDLEFSIGGDDTPM